MSIIPAKARKPNRPTVVLGPMHSAAGCATPHAGLCQDATAAAPATAEGAVLVARLTQKVRGTSANHTAAVPSPVPRIHAAPVVAAAVPRGPASAEAPRGCIMRLPGVLFLLFALLR